MGIFSRFRSKNGDSLVHTRPPETSRQEELQEDVAEDVKAVEEEGKYFAPQTPPIGS
jgi:hypothetical protein